MRKRRAEQQLGGDANWAQKQLIDALADRSPAEAKTMMRRWQMGLLAAAVIIAVLGGLLYMWSIVAGVVVHVIAIALFVLWFQLRRKQRDFEAMAELVSGGPRKKKR